MRKSLSVYWLTCVFLFLAVGVSATTIVLPSDEQLIDKSPLIVRGTVLSSTPVERDGAIWTETLLRVDRTLKGSAAEIITIREIGGVIGDRMTKIFGAPVYTAGESVVAFLTATPRGDYQTTDLLIGKFAERNGHLLQSEDSGVTVLDAGLRPILQPNIRRQTEAFEAFIAARATGRNAPINYISDDGAGLRPGSNFTLIEEPTVYRWFAFDNGGAANWVTYGAQSGYAGGGVNETQTAINVWTNYTAARINYRYSGQSAAGPGGLQSPNGLNEVLFNDPRQEIAGSYQRGRGGTVGLGGFNAVAGSSNWTAPFAADSTHTQATYRAWNITEGNLTIQDGVSEANGTSSRLLAEILAHEFGHTLGLGHSSDSSALMYGTVTGRGSSLHSDDETAARWLYPNSSGTPIPAPLAAAFGFAPASPLVDDPVSFTDQSTGGPTSWLWDFGDGTTSAQRNPVKRYTAPGGYNVTLFAYRGSETQSTRKTISIGSRSPALPTPEAFRSLVPVAAQTNGFAGSVWRTELTLFSASDEPATVNLTLVAPAGSAVASTSLTLWPYQSQTFAHALRDLFGLSSGSGAIVVEATSTSTTPVLKITSRTFADSNSGTYGQAVPDVLSPDLDRTLYITGIVANADFRTNVGLVNKSSSAVNAVLTLYDADGDTAGTANVSVGANSFQQSPLAAIFPVIANRTYSVLSLRIATSVADALSAYASVVDNRTHDPIYIQALPAPNGRGVTLPTVGRAAGANNTFWRSDVTFFNPTSERMFLTLRYWATGTTSTLALNARQTRVISDIVSQMGVESGSGSLDISWGGVAPIVTSRSYTPASGGGSFGQSIDPTTDFGAESFVTGLRSDASFRTNVGFVNGGGDAIPVEVTLLSPLGLTIAKTFIELAPRAQVQYSLGSLFPGLNVNAIGTFTLQATSNGARTLFAYGSIVDNASGDPVFFAGR